MKLDLSSIYNNIISNLIWVIIVAAVLYGLRTAKDAFKPYIVSFRTQIFVALILPYAVLMMWMFLKLRQSVDWELTVAPLIVMAMVLFFVWWTLRGFQAAQITGAFPTTKEGVGYSNSLKLVNKSLDFMGIGAAKLTNDPEFSKALDRCADLTAVGPRVRLLLASPDHPIIIETARANQAGDEEYKRNVTDSLQKIARLAEKKQGLIQVRHYNDNVVKKYPQFRLMFIDNEFCLFSWNVWDAAKGSNNPQLILRRGNAKNEARAVYKSYQKYFSDLWELGTEVDLSQYLK